MNDLADNRKTLLLLRHAKAVPWGDSIDDHERALTDRGRRDAFAVGEVLASRGLVPDIVACSTSARTRQTWDHAVRGGAEAGEVRYQEEIYAARVADLVSLVQGMPDSASVVLLVGHSPGIPDAVDQLAARTAGSPDWAELERNFPTSGLAILTHQGSWAEVGRLKAELNAFEVPRGSPK